MPARESPSYSSSRVQRASRLNALEHARLQQRLLLLEKARLHQVKLTNQDIRLTSTALEYILVRKSKVCENSHSIAVASLALRLIIRSTTNCATERDRAGLSSREPNFILSPAHAQRYRVYKYKLPPQGRRLL